VSAAPLGEPPVCESPLNQLESIDPSNGQPTGSVLEGNLELQLTAMEPVIASAQFQFAREEPEGSSSGSLGPWTTIEENNHGQVSTRAYTFLDTTGGKTPNGVYEIRALITTTGGEVCASALADLIIANNVPAVGLAVDTGSSLAGVDQEVEPDQPLQPFFQLKAKVLNATAGEPTPARAEFQYSPAGRGKWTTLGGTVSARQNNPLYETSELERATTILHDGYYDFRIVPASSDGTFVSAPVRRRLVDNTPPTVSLSNPGSPLHGRVTLSATATDPPPAGEPQDPTSGVRAVRFERRRQGIGAWSVISEATVPSREGSNNYSRTVGTDSWQNGLYQLRATAADRADNQVASTPVEDVRVESQGLQAAGSASVSTAEAPARHVTILGSVPGDGEHPTETWAYGFTSAPPAEVGNGVRLPYTAEGNQLALLRYTDQEGWQIHDVLRKPNGDPFELLPAQVVAAGGVVHHPETWVLGSMTPSGEAWIWLKERQEPYEVEEEEGGGLRKVGERTLVALFHRPPGGQFEFDEAATHELEPLLGSLEQAGPQLRLAQNSAGQTYGMLIPGSTPGREVHVKGGREGEGINVKASLEYGYLKGGKWTLKGTPGEIEADEDGRFPLYTFLKNDDTITIGPGDVTGAGEAWDAFKVEEPARTRLVLGHLDEEKWGFFPKTGLDALDLSGALAEPGTSIDPSALKADGNVVWIGARVSVPVESAPGIRENEEHEVVARYEEDGGSGSVTNSWCTLPIANSCGEPLGAAAVPDAIFDEHAEVALALADGSVNVFSNGGWKSVPAPGFAKSSTPAADAGGDAFTSESEGWLGGQDALGRFSARAASSSLTAWPAPDRFTLTSVAMPPGNQAMVGESGALAVGLNGSALSYNASVGWLPQVVPPGARHLNLNAVAFAGPASAFAVGQFGTILHWNGSAWSQDPQSQSLTQFQLNAVAFAQSGEGWAVGADGTILHYNGASWSRESAPPREAAENVTSVAAAGGEVFAVAGGNLIAYHPGRGWEDVEARLLPPGFASSRGQLGSGPLGNHGLVAGLPDGGVVAAGASTVLVRQGPGVSFESAPQPLQGFAVALAPFREAGKLRTFISIAQGAFESEPPELGGVPPGDGELLRQTDNGWQDLSRAQFAGLKISGDGAVKTDPVLAVATGSGGEHAWALGGYAGAVDAADQGTRESLATRPLGWQTASIWRYDAGGGVSAPTTPAFSPPKLPANPGTVSFAFFSGTTCKEECEATVDAQPDVNLTAAAKQISTYAAQPSGPSFAMLGGDARGPAQSPRIGEFASKTAIDFSHLPELLAPFGNLPVFAALGPRDNVPGENDEAAPWAEALAETPPPFGSGKAAPDITAVSSEKAVLTENGSVHRYYSFDAHQNGGTLRVIVLDNSKGSLEASAEGQLTWLKKQLAEARDGAKGDPPVVVVTAKPLARHTSGGEYAGDGEEVASLLAKEGVLAVFSGNPGGLDEHHAVPEHPEPGVSQIPEYEGATLGYQEPENNGVLWYFASVNTLAREVHVTAVPVLASLALKPLQGLTVPRSLTLQFEGIGRRPPGTLASLANEPFPGYENYVGIPAPSCGERPCMPPSYSFASSDPTVGEFVEPAAPGSPYPTLNAAGRPIPSSTSGLFCGYNAGTTTVSVNAGLLSYSLPVTVEPGGAGVPCGKGLPPGHSPPIYQHPPSITAAANKGAGVPPPPATAPHGNALPASVAVPPPAAAPSPPQPSPPAPAPPAPPPPAPQPPPPAAPPPAPPRAAAPPLPSPPVAEPPPPVIPESATLPPAILPTPTPPVEPIPPGASGYAQSPSAAERREKARKHASQSAFTLHLVASRSQAITPAGAGGGSEPVWFYAAVGVVTLLAFALLARGLPAGPRARPAPALSRTSETHRRRRR
jgi:hypothetical protein